MGPWTRAARLRRRPDAVQSGDVRDRSTFTAPKAYSEGVPYVMVNGELVVDEGRMTTPGRGGPCTDLVSRRAISFRAARAANAEAPRPTTTPCGITFEAV